ncbi:MAG: site-specific DNA-methyltransferase [Candidatus Kapaibacterium sp.]|nr:MAG: site-specific DNA-methyltransferase [Candidatus Kapabacteria bacterium]
MAVSLNGTHHHALVHGYSHHHGEPIAPLWSGTMNSENRLYYADNLEILRLLCEDVSIAGNVRLVYIDPPYSTGGFFQTRDFQSAYSDHLRGDEYLDFMKHRLALLYDLLASDGSCFIHLDSTMVFHVKVLMDTIFGASNFKGMITRQKCKPKNYTRTTFGNISDYILFYGKSPTSIWHRSYYEWTDEKMYKEYPYIDEKTGKRHKRVPVHAPGTRNGKTGEEWRGMMPPQGKHWQYTPDKLEEMDKRGEIYWSSNGNPRRKVFFEDSKGIPVQDIWSDCIDIENQNTISTGYPTEKNPLILQRIIEACSNKGDIVLDCFAGSGTTLEVASNLERRWIGVDVSETAITTILKRFGHGTKPLGDFTAKKVEENTSLFEATDNHIAINKQHRIVRDFTLFSQPSYLPVFQTLLHQLDQHE